jgi:hypothetical protein
MPPAPAVNTYPASTPADLAQTAKLVEAEGARIVAVTGTQLTLDMGATKV